MDARLLKAQQIVATGKIRTRRRPSGKGKVQLAWFNGKFSAKSIYYKSGAGNVVEHDPAPCQLPCVNKEPAMSQDTPSIPSQQDDQFLLTDAVRIAHSEYAAGERTEILAQRLGLNRNTLVGRWRRMGLPLRSAGQPRKPFNERAFDQAELCPEAAYWIGMLMTDGCIHQKKPHHAPHILLGLSGEDGAHLERMADFLSSVSRPRIIRQARSGKMMILGRSCTVRPVTRLQVTSWHTAASLASYGVLPRKTYSARVSRLEASRDFWRGAVCGDGSLMISERDGPVLAIVGSQSLMSQFAEYLTHVIGKALAVHKNHKGECWLVRTSGRAAVMAVRHLFRPNDIALPRKAQLAARISEIADDTGRVRPECGGPKQKCWSHIPDDLIFAALDRAGGKRSVAAREIGVPLWLVTWRVCRKQARNHV